ncbi:MAG TPA: flagellar motor stator protein MotA [Bryobacteraceae bacterium]|jgi:chemotaxis protein MotA
MFALIGIFVVIGAIVGGYLLEKGNLAVLVQPAELLIIGGAAVGTLLIANPLHILKGILSQVLSILKGSKYNKAAYLEALNLLNDLFNLARKEGAAKLEQEIEAPEQGQVFSRYTLLAKDHFAATYICDTLRMSLVGGITPHDLEMLMETDAEIHHHEEEKAVTALSTTADSLPGLGIVAAVLGVVITMGAIGGPPEEIGHKVAAALVGTFLGILLCYGFIGPLASNISKLNGDANDFYRVLRVGIAGYVKGMPPFLAAESARRMVPPRLRPSMQEMEESFKASKAGATAAPAEAAEPAA